MAGGRRGCAGRSCSLWIISAHLCGNVEAWRSSWGENDGWKLRAGRAHLLSFGMLFDIVLIITIHIYSRFYEDCDFD